ncbi:hypothetical protein LQ318_15645 [Aliifodinibius salicampi]|uniref:Uncharacterized protein n=1 Tax=Fodinibius salicampi TaxID=1920655 RepID=A0ABT3Q2J6_9BACT|nr:hypothetical protein [Fodinibius salicampi]MCW9714342.1 hypothetical protein [Fodinibius salicampi]
MNITVQDGNQISEEAIEELNKHADMIECECPSKLMEILQLVRNFTEYTEQCIEKYPEDEATHRWLKSSSMNLDQLISTTLIQLSRFEGFINENNEIVSRDAAQE